MHRARRHLPARLRAVAIATGAASAAALQPLRPRVRRFRRWVAETAIRLPSLTGWEDVEVLSALDPLLEGKRFAFIGENEHWVHEKYPYRLLLIRYLRSRGWRTIGEELSFSDGVRVDSYLASGDPAELDHVTTYGYRGCARKDRDDSPQGVLRAMLERHPEAAMGAEQKEFARGLRSLGRSGAGPVRFFGFDVDYEPGAAYELLEQVLATATRDGVVVKLRGVLARVLGETLAEEVERLNRACLLVEEGRDALEQALGPAGFASLRRLVRAAATSHRYVRMIQAAVTFEDLSPAMALREQIMLEHVEHAVSLLPPGEKVVLLGHNLHLARDPSHLRELDAFVGPGGGLTPFLGSELEKRYPGEIFTVWMLEDRGRDSCPLPSAGGRVRSVRGTLNSLLARVGAAPGGGFLFLTGSVSPCAALLSRPVTVATLYGKRVAVLLPAQADAVYFIGEVTPLRTGAVP